MKRGFFGLKFPPSPATARQVIAALLAVVVASALVGGTLGAANLVRAGIEKAQNRGGCRQPRSAVGDSGSRPKAVCGQLFALSC